MLVVATSRLVESGVLEVRLIMYEMSLQVAVPVAAKFSVAGAETRKWIECKSTETVDALSRRGGLSAGAKMVLRLGPCL